MGAGQQERAEAHSISGSCSVHGSRGKQRLEDQLAVINPGHSKGLSRSLELRPGASSPGCAFVKMTELYN